MLQLSFCTLVYVKIIADYYQVNSMLVLFGGANREQEHFGDVHVLSKAGILKKYIAS